MEDDWRLVATKTGPTRLGFALLLKFIEQEGRFPAPATGCRGKLSTTSPLKALLARCRAVRIESPGRPDRIVAAARAAATEAFCGRTLARPGGGGDQSGGPPR